MNLRNPLKLLTFLVVFGGVAFADDGVVPGSRYTSARGAALGDAFLPLADDGASALFYNPAGIAKIRHPSVEPLNMELKGNSDFVSMLNRNSVKATSLSSYAPTVEGHEPKAPELGATLFPNASFRGFAIGLLMQSDLKSQAQGQTIINQSRYQLIPAAGGAVRLFSGIVRLGYSIQYVNEAIGPATLNSTGSPTPLGYNQGLQTGAGFSHTFGAALTLPWVYLPSLNFVARNAFGTRYSSKPLMTLADNSSGTPPTEKMSFDGSLSYVSKVGRGSYFNVVAEYRDATNTSHTTTMERAAFGLEFSLRDAVFLRGGLGSGYPCMGIGMRRKKAEFNLSWYSVEDGSTYKSQRNIQYLLQYVIRAF